MRHMFGIGVLQILLIQPEQFTDINTRRGIVHVMDLKQIEHLINAKDFLITMRPAQSHEIV